jgi:divalent metal cation (Fe/Co/Zn/Cd) transporter
VTLLLVAVFLLVSATHALVAHDEPGYSIVGTVIAVASPVVLPVLAVRKFNLAAAIPSRALWSDGILTTAGAVLAAVTLVALLLNETVHWWWADSVAAVVAAVAVVGRCERELGAGRRRTAS